MSMKYNTGPGEGKFQKAAQLVASLALLLRFGVPRLGPKTLKSRGTIINQAQECARRRRHFERFGRAIGGGPLWAGGGKIRLLDI